MTNNIQLSFFDTQNYDGEIDDWTFNKASTRELTHCYHDYPARMIPQVAGKLIDNFGLSAKYLFDPYCGSGTSLVEANIRGINAIGTDLNPLARLVSLAKTSRPMIDFLESQIVNFSKLVLIDKLHKIKEHKEIYGITNLDFWFKPEVVERLLIIRDFIQDIDNEEVRLFFQVAFSETVR